MRPSELDNFRKIATSKVKQTNNYIKKENDMNSITFQKICSEYKAIYYVSHTN